MSATAPIKVYAAIASRMASERDRELAHDVQAIGLDADATIAALQRENEALRNTLSKVATNIGNGVFAPLCCSLGFFESVAEGVKLEMTKLRAQLVALQAQAAQSRAALREVASWEMHSGTDAYARCEDYGEKFYLMEAEIMAARKTVCAALAQTPEDSLARYNAMARVCEAAAEYDRLAVELESVLDNRVRAQRIKMQQALAALRSIDTKAGGV